MNPEIEAEIEKERADLERSAKLSERVLSLYERLLIAADDEHQSMHDLAVIELPLVAEHVQGWKRELQRQEAEIERLESRSNREG